MKFLNKIIGVCALLVASQANAATIFIPTDGDVNFLLGDLNGAQLAIFDDSDQSYTGLSLGVSIGDIVGFAGPNGSSNYIATNTTTANTLLLTNNSSFILGLSTDGGNNWMAESSIVSLGANAYTVIFSTGNSITEVDVRIAPVPVPAAVWLLGSGLIGLAGIARRKKA
jgi:hypothetical protein